MKNIIWMIFNKLEIPQMYSENTKENENYYVPIDVCRSLQSFWGLKRIWIS